METHHITTDTTPDDQGKVYALCGETDLTLGDDGNAYCRECMDAYLVLQEDYIESLLTRLQVIGEVVRPRNRIDAYGVDGEYTVATVIHGAPSAPAYRLPHIRKIREERDS
jgi:hypothetical protein